MNISLWDIQKIIDNPYTRVKMFFNDKFGRKKTILGYMIDETFPISTSANYGNALDSLAQMMSAAPLPGKLGGFQEAFGSGMELLKGAGGLTGFSNIAQATIKKWDGSDAPQFSVGYLAVALNPDDKPQEDAAIIASMALPRLTANNTIFEAPMGYKPIEFATGTALETAKNVNGLCTLSIGTWFEAFGLLIEAADFEASKECIQSGSPLYVTGKVTFSPYRDISYSEWLQYFKISSGSSGGDTGTSSGTNRGSA